MPGALTDTERRAKAADSMRRWRAANPDRNRELKRRSDAKYYASRRSELLKRKASAYAANPEPVRARMREYHRANRDAIRTKREGIHERLAADLKAWKARNAEAVRVYGVRYREEHREELRAAALKRYHADPAKHIAKVKAWRAANPAKRLAIEARKRMKRHPHEFVVEPVDRMAIFKRDRGLCGLCGMPVDPKDFTLDHLVPISRGGSHVASNLVTAHKSCNCRKGTRTMAELAAIA